MRAYRGCHAPGADRVIDYTREDFTRGTERYDRKLLMLLAKPKPEDLAAIRDLMAAGKVTPVVGRRYSLREAPEAMRYLEGGHARGKVVVTP